MMAIKSKHKAPTLTILRQSERENGNRSTQRGVLKRGLPRCGMGLPTCFVLYCSPHFCQQQTLQREQRRKEQNKMIQKFVLMPRTFYAFLYNFFSSFCSVFVCVCSSSLPHIVLHLCSDSSKNAVCLSPLLYPEANRNLCNIINPFAFLISNSAWPERKDIGQGCA